MAHPVCGPAGPIAVSRSADLRGGAAPLGRLLSRGIPVLDAADAAQCTRDAARRRNTHRPSRRALVRRIADPPALASGTGLPAWRRGRAILDFLPHPR